MGKITHTSKGSAICLPSGCHLSPSLWAITIIAEAIKVDELGQEQSNYVGKKGMQRESQGTVTEDIWQREKLKGAEKHQEHRRSGCRYHGVPGDRMSRRGSSGKALGTKEPRRREDEKNIRHSGQKAGYLLDY